MICRSNHQLGVDENYNKLDDMIHAGSVPRSAVYKWSKKYSYVYNLLQDTTLYTQWTFPSSKSTTFYASLEKTTIKNLPPFLPHLMCQLPHLSRRLHRPVVPHSTAGWQPPFKDSVDLPNILQQSHLHEEGYPGRLSHLEMYE